MERGAASMSHPDKPQAAQGSLSSCLDTAAASSSSTAPPEPARALLVPA